MSPTSKGGRAKDRPARLRDPTISRTRATLDADSCFPCRLAVEYLAATRERLKMLSEGKLKRLSGRSQYAADKCYFSTTARLCEGLERTVASYKDTEDTRRTAKSVSVGRIVIRRGRYP